MGSPVQYSTLGQPPAICPARRDFSKRDRYRNIRPASRLLQSVPCGFRSSLPRIMQCSPSNGATVRCLGWENLDRPIGELTTSVESSLQQLGVPFRVISAGPEQSAFVATPVQLSLDSLHAVRDDDDDPELRVCIHIVAAEAENAGKHHIRLRRQKGDHWRFQSFYAAFRKEMSRSLGLTDERQLSLYSPMVTKRPRPVSNGPLSAWSCDAQHESGPSSGMTRSPAKMPMLLSQSPRGSQTMRFARYTPVDPRERKAT